MGPNTTTVEIELGFWQFKVIYDYPHTKYGNMKNLKKENIHPKLFDLTPS